MILGTAGHAAPPCTAWSRTSSARTWDPSWSPAPPVAGMLAIDILTRAGYEAHAITGKLEHFDDLIAMAPGSAFCAAICTGASARSNQLPGLAPSTTWAARCWPDLTRVIHPYGNIASCGLAGGTDPPPRRHAVHHPRRQPARYRLGRHGAGHARCIWQTPRGDWKPAHLERIATREVTPAELPDVFDGMLAGGSFGRTVVRIGSDSRIGIHP